MMRIRGLAQHRGVSAQKGKVWIPVALHHNSGFWFEPFAAVLGFVAKTNPGIQDEGGVDLIDLGPHWPAT